MLHESLLSIDVETGPESFEYFGALFLGAIATEDLLEQDTAWSITRRSCGSKKNLAGDTAALFNVLHDSLFDFCIPVTVSTPKAIFSCCRS